MSRTTRRSFAKAVAVTAVSVAVPASGTIGGRERPPLHEALTSVVRAQSGQYLDDADIERIRSDFKDYVPALERLRAVKLANSDEPDVAFAALPKRWS